MNVLDLFSGIGGFSLGLERVGMHTVAFCERDEFCRAVLAKHWPGVPCFDDVRTLDAIRLGGLGRIDLVCGGFPCQPFSSAGPQRAQTDDRYLWPAMRNVIALARPAWVVGENVTGIITLALDDVLADLEGLGYAARPFVIPAIAVDARHKRDRVWIIARDPNHEGEPAMPFDDEVARLRSTVADATGGRLPRLGGGGQERTAKRCRWLPEPAMGRVANGVPRRMDRLRALGNAVVPQVVEEIGRAIMSSQA